MQLANMSGYRRGNDECGLPTIKYLKATPEREAASDMLAALQGAMVIIETVPWPDDISDGVRAAFDMRRAAIQSAIAKAEGRAP